MVQAHNQGKPQFGQLTTAELDIYGRQFARCLKALGTNAPIRAGVQRELTEVRRVQESRSMASEPQDSGRQYQVAGLATHELERIRRELQASLALMHIGSPARGPALTYMKAIDVELDHRAEGAPS